MNITHTSTLLNSIPAELSLRLTLAMAHLLWQGCAIAVVYAVAEQCLRRASAQARYVLATGALLLMAACIPAALLFLPVTPATVTAAEFDAPLPMAIDARPADLPAATSGPLRTSAANPTARSSSATPGVHPGLTHAEIATYITAAYGVGLALMLSRMAVALWGGHRLRGASRQVDDPWLLAAVREQARRLEMRVVPLVAWCSRVSVPVVVGVLRPTILLPATLATGLSAEQLQAVLLHELAHVRRYDLAVNVVQRLIEALLFFHPAVWWISHRVATLREHACDDLVLAAGCPRLGYADALVRMAEIALACGGTVPSGVLAATGKHSFQLDERVRRILSAGGAPQLRLSASGVVTLLVLFCGLLLLPAAWSPTAQSAHSTRSMEVNRNAGLTGSIVIDEQDWGRARVELQIKSAGDPPVEAQGKMPPQAGPALTHDQDQPAADLEPADPPQDKPAVGAAPSEALPATHLEQALRIVNPAGEPIANVTIEGLQLVSPSANLDWQVSEVGEVAPVLKTDADGRATVRFPRVAGKLKERTGGFSVRLSHPGRVQIETYVPTGPRERTPVKSITLHAGSVVTVVGTVDDRRVPLDRAYVMWGNRGLMDQQQPKLGAAGELTLPRIAPGAEVFRLVSIPEQGLVRFSELTQLDLKDGEPRTLVLRLKPAVTISGRLDDSVPRPVKRGIVCAAGSDPLIMNSYGTTWRASTTINPDGTFTFESMPEGDVQLAALCDGFMTEASPAPEWYEKLNARGKEINDLPQLVRLSDPPQPIVVKMTPAAACALQVLGSDGAPVQGARCSFSPNLCWLDGGNLTYCDVRYSSLEMLTNPKRFAERLRTEDHPFHAGYSDEQGRVVFHSIPLKANATGMGVYYDDMDAASGEPRKGLKVYRPKLVAGEQVEVTVKLPCAGKLPPEAHAPADRRAGP